MRRKQDELDVCFMEIPFTPNPKKKHYLLFSFSIAYHS